MADLNFWVVTVFKGVWLLTLLCGQMIMCVVSIQWAWRLVTKQFRGN